VKQKKKGEKERKNGINSGQFILPAGQPLHFACASQTNQTKPKLWQQSPKIPAKKSRACLPIEISFKRVVYQH
jgi:hypothetical protein